MGPLRVMTFNVQMLPWVADALHSTTNDAPERADRVARALFALPVVDQPDVIAFNEVFDEDGRDRLRLRLSGRWPHIVDKIHDGGVLEDSGLMLFSRRPLLALPDGGNFHERFFTESAGDDTMAAKGVGVIQVDSPDGVDLPTTIAFTHMQASYLSEDEHRDVRRSQLDTLYTAVKEVIGSSPELWERVIVLGDLNIRGDSEALTDEWAEIFDLASTELTRLTHDGWRTGMHPPNDQQDHDLGRTNLNWESGQGQRLDYMLFGNENERGLVAHHMYSRIRNASDHFSLEAVVQRRSDHCRPADAIDLHQWVTAAGGSPGRPSTLHHLPLEFDFPGTLQWLYVDTPGTFTLWSAADVETRAYTRSDLSRPLAQLRTVSKNDLESGLQAPFREATVNPVGTTHVAAEPFYIVARSRRNRVGNRDLLVLEHHGESPATAIALAPHTPTETGFPVGRKLGDNDECWFIAALPETFAGDPREEAFSVYNPDRIRCSLSVRDLADEELMATSGTGQYVNLTHSTSGGYQVYLVMRRNNIQYAGFTLAWKTPISYLMLDRPLGLFIRNESGADWPGADEVHLDVWLDSRPVFNGYWDDADTGETWGGLASSIEQLVRAQMPGIGDRVPFSTSINLSYLEEDFTAAGWLTASVAALSPAERDTVDRQVTLPVPDAISDGTYTFYCSVTRLG